MTQYSNLGGEWHRHVERLTPRGRTGDKCPWVDGWGRMAIGYRTWRRERGGRNLGRI